jgi:DNA damage-inducible protein 1
VDLLLGLDMLKAHQACIDLEKSVLRIQGREVRFLSEHELPEQARLMDSGVEDPSASTSGSSSSVPQPSQSSVGGDTRPPFPGGGNTLGSAPTPRAATRPAATQTRHPESAIELLMGLGVSREIAISTLDAAGGNVDVAASLLF